MITAIIAWNEVLGNTLMLLKENELRATFYRNRSSEELKRFESGSTRREMDTPSVLMVNTALYPFLEGKL